MRIKRIRETDMQSALERVRTELGPDAVIVSTRTLGSTLDERRRGMRGVEVVAGLDETRRSVLAEAQQIASAAAGVAPGAARAAYALQMTTTDERREVGLPLAAVKTPEFRKVERGAVERDSLEGLVPAFAALAKRGPVRQVREMDARVAPGSTEGELEGERAGAFAALLEATLAGRAPAGTDRDGDPSFPSGSRTSETSRNYPRPAPTPAPRAGTERTDEGRDYADETRHERRTATSSLSAPAAPYGSVTSERSAVAQITRIDEPRASRGESWSEDSPAPLTRTFGRGGTAVTTAPAARVTATPSAAHLAAERTFEWLCEAGLMEGVAEAAVTEAIVTLPRAALNSDERLMEAALAHLVARVPNGPTLTEADLGGRTVLFVGMSGVGKTTAVLKAALRLRRDGMDVGIVGADVSRLGAPEQLVRYGQLLRLPVEVAYAPDDLGRLLAAAPAGRVILVDTPACQAAPEMLSTELAGLMTAVHEPVVVMTVAAGTGQRDLERLAATSRVLGAAAAAVTKLDESECSGAALNVLACLNLPPLLCSTGRDVLTDISVATVADMAIDMLDGAAAGGVAA